MEFKSEFPRRPAGMDRMRLERAFARLGQLLRERRLTGEIAVFGGAAIVLGFDPQART